MDGRLQGGFSGASYVPAPMTSILGLPAHPLFAHIPVVLIPLAAVGAVAMLWPGVRDRIGWVVVGLVFVAGIACQAAISSGQTLREYVRETSLMRSHVRMGESIRPWVLLMFLALLGVMLVARRAQQHRAAATESPHRRADRRTHDRLKYAGIALTALSLLFSAVAVVTVVRIGHSGSKAVWERTQVRIDRGAGDGGEAGG